MSSNGDLRIAEEVFERVLRSLEGPAAPPSSNGHTLPPASRVRLTQVRSAAARTLDLYAELFQRSFETYADLAQAALQPGTDPAPDTPLALSGPAGGVAQTTVWLHNQRSAAARDIALFMTDLTAPSGARIPSGAAQLEPATLQLEAGTSASSLLRVAIPPGVPHGRYHGHVLSAALPASALALCLVVAP